MLDLYLNRVQLYEFDFELWDLAVPTQSPNSNRQTEFYYINHHQLCEKIKYFCKPQTYKLYVPGWFFSNITIENVNFQFCDKTEVVWVMTVWDCVCCVHSGPSLSVADYTQSRGAGNIQGDRRRPGRPASLGLDKPGSVTLTHIIIIIIIINTMPPYTAYNNSIIHISYLIISHRAQFEWKFRH